MSLVYPLEAEQAARQRLPGHHFQRVKPDRRKRAVLDVKLKDAILDAKPGLHAVAPYCGDDVMCCFHVAKDSRKLFSRKPHFPLAQKFFAPHIHGKEQGRLR